MATSSESKLKTYRQKRDFTKTAEPAGGKAADPKKAKALGFVVQKHDATRLHYDFRLELDGVLMSWAVTKGPSTNPADKRLAVHVEDHPIEYGKFEGTIPEKEYGGGTVMLWDEGTWEPIGDPHDGLAKGDLKFILHGKRMKGSWVLVHMKGRDNKTRNGVRENWLLIKHHDEYATLTDGLTEKFTTSVETGRDLAGIAKGNKSRKKTAPLEEQPPSTNVWTGGKARALPDFREPELATLVEEIPTGRDWLFEMKYDGYRALAAVAGDQVRIFTRNANDWTVQFHSMVAPLAKLTKGSALLDGEIVAFKDGRTDFSALKDALSNGAPLSYFAFDLLEQDGEDLRKLPLTDRKARLKTLIENGKAGPAVHYSEHVVGNGQAVFEAMRDAGFEGVVAKLGRSPYRGERSRDWLKIKATHRQEFVIGGWRPSDKKSTFASLLLGTYEAGKFIYRGRVGTGYSEEVAADLQTRMDRLARKTSPFVEVPRDIVRRAKWIEPDLVGEIEYAEVTPEGYLRHAAFIGLRTDKKAKEVKLEKAAAPPAEADAKPKPKAATKASPKSAAVKRLEAQMDDEPAPAIAPTKKAPAKKTVRKKPAKLADVPLTDAMGIAAAKALRVNLTHPDRVIYPSDGVTKAQIVAYYGMVAERMLPHVIKRPLSLVRTPQGQGKQTFFQKHDSGGFPDQFKDVPILEKDGTTENYMYIDGPDGLAAGVQMSTLEFHIWGSHIDDVDKPDRIIFDIDPDEGLDFTATKDAAISFRDRLEAMGLKTYAMVTGGKGIHVIAPLKPTVGWVEVKTFCHDFAEMVAREEPERFTANIRKNTRKGRMFVDYLRNERGSTAVAPFSTRARVGAPCAVPMSWDELETLDRANGFSLPQAAAKAQEPDPWADYFDQKQAITAKMLKAVAE